MAAGLSSTDAQRLLAELGPNEIRREQTTTLLTLLARQFASPVIWLLLGASMLSNQDRSRVESAERRRGDDG